MKITILIGLFICHFLADYTHLSTSWMLNAKRLGKPMFPIFCHALVHSTLMWVFINIYFYIHIESYNMFDSEYMTADLLFLFQLITHFLIDVWKGRMNNWFPSLQSPTNKWHWIVFGFDQLLHSTVIIIMSYFIN